MSAVARRYAKAALGEPVQPQAATDLAAALRQLAQACQQHPQLREVFSNPLERAHWRPLLAQLGQQLQLAPPATRLAQVLADNDRLAQLGAVATAVEALGDAAAGRLRAQVQTAVPLTAAQRAHMGEALQKRMGRPVALELSVVPELLGGIVCRIGDWTFNSSLRHQLRQFAGGHQA